MISIVIIMMTSNLLGWNVKGHRPQVNLLVGVRARDHKEDPFKITIMMTTMKKTLMTIMMTTMMSLIKKTSLKDMTQHDRRQDFGDSSSEKIVITWPGSPTAMNVQ